MHIPSLPVFLYNLTPLDACIARMGSVRMGCVLAELEQRIVLRTRLSEAQNHRCCWCGRRFGDTPGAKDAPTLEHIVPASQDGGDGEGNLAAACARCNSKRGVKDVGTFFEHVLAIGWTEGRTPTP